MPLSRTDDSVPVLFTVETATPAPIPERELPMTRMMECGPEYLTDSEILSLVLPRKSPEGAEQLSRLLLERFGSLYGVAQAGVPELAAVPGISPRGACTIQAALAMSSRLIRHCAPDRIRLGGPKDVAEYLRPLFQCKVQEIFHVLLVDAKEQLLRDETVTIGLLNQAPAHSREIYRTAIRHACARIILAHNHPSMDPTPSAADIECTRSLVAAGKIIGIEVVDHVIIGEPTISRPQYWLSFRESRLM